MEVAICADLSSSTKGLLEAMRTNMWYLMHYLTSYQPQPDVRFGMVLYGKPGYGEKNDYNRLISDLGKRINSIQEELYSTSVSEPALENFPEKALLKTIEELSWSEGTDVYKTIFFIGNGAINTSELKKIAKAAKKKGIIVNAMYYKTYHNLAELNQWTELAKALEVELVVIDPTLVTPWEKDIKSSNTELMLQANEKYNNTFLYYGEGGYRRHQMYLQMDKYASESGKNCLELRFMYKISENYFGVNSDWDLIDYSMHASIDTTKLDKKLLPEQYRTMTFENILKVVERKKEERLYLRDIGNIYSSRNRILTHDYYQEYKGTVHRALYFTILEVINSQIDNYHLILD